jgi:hypothetical protein
MDLATFASTKTYPALEYVMEKLNNLEEKGQYINTFLAEFNENIVALKSLSKNERYGYIVQCVRNDYKIRLDRIDGLFDDKKFTSHLRNFVYAKFKAL